MLLAMTSRRYFFSIRVALLCGGLILWPLAVRASHAKNNERTYEAPFDKVWTVCVETATKEWTVTYSDQASGILKFHQGTSFKTNSLWGVNIRITVGRLDDRHTKVTLTSEKINPVELSWSGRDIAKKLFAVLDRSFVAGSGQLGNPNALDSGNHHQ